jgi:hypothetical protein
MKRRTQIAVFRGYGDAPRDFQGSPGQKTPELVFANFQKKKPRKAPSL